MITWILGGIILFWILLNRFSQDGKIKGQPLGMPRGTVRALITIMIVAFPFGYLMRILYLEFFFFKSNSHFISTNEILFQ